jgi:predicted ATPase/DNA-binding CsgD family transcriptional regulator
MPRCACGSSCATHSPALPVRLDRFVGRDSEVAELRRLLGRSRLVTLLGAGGVGKTRLAVELARRREDAVFVDLGSATDPARLPLVLADALSIRLPSTDCPLDTIAEELLDRRVLLLLDGCERLAQPCAEIVDELLRRCRGLRVLATSQESLRVPGEITMAVPPLPVPDSHAGMLRSDAVRLFVERAREHVPDFEPTPAVADICTRLDGVPLAIEFATRWVRLLPADELLARLDDQLDLLTAGPRTATGRHRSLRAAITWSVDLLTEVERRVLRRLAVFAGGFEVAAATAVCADVPSGAVLVTLASLEAKSLVVPVKARLRLLESIRLFGLEELTAAGELDVTRDRLADWLCALVDSLPERVFACAETVRRLEDERANLAQAMRWVTGDRWAQLATTAARHLWERGETAQACAMAAHVLADDDLVPAHRSVAFQQAAWFACWEGRHEQALRLAEVAVELERSLDRPLVLGEALGILGLARLTRAEFAAAVACYEECLVIVQPLGQPRHIARWLHDLAWATLRAGDPQRAATLLAEALKVIRIHAISALLAGALHTAGALDLELDRTDPAEHRFREALRSGRVTPYLTPRALEGLAIVATRRGQHERALRLFGSAAATRRNFAEPDGKWREAVHEATEQARARLRRPFAESALAAGHRMRPKEFILYALHDTPPAGAAGGAAEHNLTDREWEVARLVSGGMTNRQIACRLAVSGRTVDAHLQHVRDKLGLRSRTQVAVWAAEHVRQEATSASTSSPASVARMRLSRDPGPMKPSAMARST